MTNLNITAEIQNNMNTVLDTIRQICDKDGSFEYNELKATGLTRAEVAQALVYLNKTGQTIIKMRSEASYWMWTNVKWARLDLAKAC